MILYLNQCFEFKLQDPFAQEEYKRITLKYFKLLQYGKSIKVNQLWLKMSELVVCLETWLFSPNIDTDFLRQFQSVTCHVSLVTCQGRGPMVMKGVTAIIGSDLDGRQILHDNPQA